MGSWKEWFQRSRPALEKEGLSIYDEVKEALRRQQIDGAGADALEKRARAASDIVKSMENTPNAFVRLGDTVFAKATINGQARLMLETVTPPLARELEQNPQISSNPAAFFELIDSGINRQQLPK